MWRKLLGIAIASVGAQALACAPPAPPSPVEPPLPTIAPAPPPTDLSETITPAPTTAPPDTPERRGDGVDLVHVACTLDIRVQPMRARCGEARGALPADLAACDHLTRRHATPSEMSALSAAWEAAAPRVSNGGGPLRPGAGVRTPPDLPRPESVGGRPALMLIDMRVLGQRHEAYRSSGCDHPPPNTGCDPVAVGQGALVPAEARGSVQMVSQGFLGVGRCTGGP
ncbi:MAG: hypothetical protein KC731_02350 [Myxococcales bacterium]|nr:hypothetical protein [Myxococcales bacterium]